MHISSDDHDAAARLEAGIDHLERLGIERPDAIRALSIEWGIPVDLARAILDSDAKPRWEE
jgi:hypothetical protein